MHMTLPQRMYLLMYTVDKKKLRARAGRSCSGRRGGG